MDSAPEFLYGFLIAGFLAVVLFCRGVRFSPPAVLRPEIWFLVLWTVLPPTALFLISYTTPMKVFLLGFAASLPGMALLVAWIIGSFQPASARTILTIALALGAVFERGGRTSSTQQRKLAGGAGRDPIPSSESVRYRC